MYGGINTLVAPLPTTPMSASSSPYRRQPSGAQPSHRKRRCKSVGAGNRHVSFVFPTNPYTDFDMTIAAPCCSSDAEINSMAGSAVALSKNLISRISSRLKQRKPLPPRPIRCAPERVNGFTRPLGMQLPKNLELTMRYLQEVIRNGQIEMYYTSLNEMIDALISYLKTSPSIYSADATLDIRSALEELIDFVDGHIIDNFVSHSEPCSSNRYGASDSNFGLLKLQKLENALMDKQKDTECLQSKKGRLSPCSDSGVDAEHTTPTSKDSNFSFASSDNSADDTLTDLLQQLQLRKIERFEPNFGAVFPDSDDDDNDVHVDEEHEEREEKHGSKTCEEEVERRPDGREIRMKKTRTVNVSQSSKCVTIRTHGNGTDDVMRKFRDGSNSFNDDSNFETKDFFSKPAFSRFRNQNPSFSFDEEPTSPKSPDVSTKTKTMQHSSATLQSVARQAKRDGKLVADNAAHKLDTAELEARQIDTFQGTHLLDRKGDGSYEESTIIRNGLPGIDGTPNSPLAPIKRNVVEVYKTLGDNDVEGKDNFFQATTLASYITLNDNLRLFEEQHRKKFTYTFGTSACTLYAMIT
uniref:Ras-GEF domain-containing protein n=1 Tax=Panagrellus redivivus TaxID=6233 RepID=A0A7E4UPS7_PANRE